MTPIPHKQAIKWIDRRLDGLLNERQLSLLDEHLNSCETCRTYSAQMDLLPARLQNEFHTRWDAQPGPSQKVIEHVTTKARRIPMLNRVSSGVKLVAGLAALIAMAFLINLVISRLQNTSPATSETQTADASSFENTRLLAFASDQTGNFEIYTMHADGSNFINLTDNPANDNNPLWSPDGKKIAFTSDRTGNTDIFLMNSDGSDLTQLTDNPGYDGSFSWSPDGRKFIYLSSSGNDPNTGSQLMVMNPDGSNKSALTGKGSFMFLGWSPDSQKILYQKYQPEPSVRVDDAGIYVVNADGQNQHEWTIGPMNGIRWEDSDHFIAVTLKNNGEQRPTWFLQRLSTDGNPPVELGYHSAPILAIFEKTYIVESQDALRWHSLDGNLKPLSTWNFDGKCKKFSDPFLQDTNHLISPDGKYAFVTVYCPEGTTLFYFENADGSEIKQLTDFSVAEPSLFSDATWSPDGKYVTIAIMNRDGSNADFYLFDIEKMLNDPSTQPVRLTTDGAMKYGAVWQPKP